VLRAVVTSTLSWTCPSCAAAVSTPYCASCGERRPLSTRDLTLRALFEQLFHVISSVDGRLLRSLRGLLTRPGALTLAFVRGERKNYLGPIQLFFIANALFFATQSLTHMNVFSSSLDSHLHHQDWSNVAQSLVAERVQAKHVTLEAYAPVFDHAVVLNAKSLVILMVLPFALLLPLVFSSTPQPFVGHAVFALHFYAFLLLLFCAALVVALVSVWLGGPGLSSTRMDHAVSIVNFGVCLIYLYLAIGACYHSAGVLRLVQVLVLGVAAAGIVIGYRFLLLLITLYTT